MKLAFDRYLTMLFCCCSPVDPLLAEHTFVPEVIRELTTLRILTTELVHGVPIEKVHPTRIALLFHTHVY